jgi:Putative transmembrane protein (PGPGW)
MDYFESITDWFQANDHWLWWLVPISIATFLLTPIATAWTLVRLPPDYFVKEERQPLESWKHRPALRMTLLAIKNLLGVLLIMAGLVMLVVPGQGLLTIAVGLVLTDFPGKFRLQRWIVTRKGVWRSIEWLRKRAGKAGLKRPTSAAIDR